MIEAVVFISISLHHHHRLKRPSTRRRSERRLLGPRVYSTPYGLVSFLRIRCHFPHHLCAGIHHHLVSTSFGSTRQQPDRCIHNPSFLFLICLFKFPRVRWIIPTTLPISFLFCHHRYATLRRCWDDRNRPRYPVEVRHSLPRSVWAACRME